MTFNHVMCCLWSALGTVALGASIWMGRDMWRNRWTDPGCWLGLVLMVGVVLWSAFSVVRFL